jgi:hypothetical protein
MGSRSTCSRFAMRSEKAICPWILPWREFPTPPTRLRRFGVAASAAEAFGPARQSLALPESRYQVHDTF